MIPKIIHCCWFGGKKTALAARQWAFAADWAHFRGEAFFPEDHVVRL